MAWAAPGYFPPVYSPTSSHSTSIPFTRLHHIGLILLFTTIKLSFCSVHSVTPFCLPALHRLLVSLQIPDQISPVQKGCPRHLSRLHLLSHLLTLIFPACFLHSPYLHQILYYYVFYYLTRI